MPVWEMIVNDGYATNYDPVLVRKYAHAIAEWIKEAHRAELIPENCAVVVRGVSGVSAGFASLALGIVDFPIVLSRKPGEDTHGSPVEGPKTWGGWHYTPASYIILDDLVCTGSTVRNVRQAMKAEYPGANFLGVLVYRRTLDTVWECEEYGRYHVWACLA